jgi:hypothetical protein
MKPTFILLVQNILYTILIAKEKMVTLVRPRKQSIHPAGNYHCPIRRNTFFTAGRPLHPPEYDLLSVAERSFIQQHGLLVTNLLA